MSLLCSTRLLVVCSFGLVWFHTHPCPHRFPELFQPNPHTTEPGEHPGKGTARPMLACVRRSAHLLCTGALKISLGEGKWDAAPLELAGPTLAFTSPLPSGDTGSVCPDLPAGRSPRAAPGPGRAGSGHVLWVPAEQLTGEPFPLLKGTRVSPRSNNYLSLRALQTDGNLSRQRGSRAVSA